MDTAVGRAGGHVQAASGTAFGVPSTLKMLAEGVNADGLLADFPDLKAEGIRACLPFAARRADIARLVA